MRLRIQNYFLRFRRRCSHISTMQVIALSFLLLILAGSILLTLPAAARTRRPTPFLTTLFTATSATCVTGLSLVDTCAHWSGFGQAVILVLIQTGGLGFMTVMSMVFFAVNHRIGLKERLIMAQSLGVDQLNGVVSLVRGVLKGTFLIEGAGALILTLRFCSITDFGTALWWGVFHSVSAFCNAGFDILGAVDVGGSLIPFAGDVVVNVTLMLLITLGGLGFFVWRDVIKNRRFSRMSVYTRLVLTISAVLVLGGWAVFAVMEWNNPATLGAMPTGEKLLAALFQSVTTRTAGFYTVPQGALTGASKAVTDALMLIGGSSGSTAGGIKTVTIGVVLLSALATARGQSRVTVFHRSINPQQIGNAVTVVTMVFLLAFAAGIYVSASNGLDFMDCFFETASAIATVGLSTGITAALNVSSKVILIVLMFFGRVGILTISLGFLLSNQAKERYHCAETKLLIG